MALAVLAVVAIIGGAGIWLHSIITDPGPHALSAAELARPLETDGGHVRYPVPPPADLIDWTVDFPELNDRLAPVVNIAVRRRIA